MGKLRTRFVPLLAAAATIGITIAPASAEVLTFNYTGTVIQAENFEPSYPELPRATTHPGEAYRGSFSFDTDELSFDDGTNSYTASLRSIDFFLPEEGFSDDFAGPGGIITFDADTGLARIFGGRADYQYRANLTFDLGPGPFEPTRIFGKSGSIEFIDYGPNGFRVQGPAVVAPVPEPATWLMLLMSVGLAWFGARLRLPKSRLAPVPA